MDEKYSIDLLTALAERTIKRLWVLIIILVILLFASNAAWIYYESQFAVEESTIEANADDGSTAIGANGEVIYNGG